MYIYNFSHCHKCNMSMEKIIINKLKDEILRLELNYPNFHIHRIQKLKKKLKRIKTNLKKKKKWIIYS